MNDRQITLSDGRVLAFADVGEPGWPCAFFFHGAPASRLRVAYLESELRRRRVRVISPDRPGYGGSSPQPNRAMDDWAADVRELADAVGVPRFVVAGHSSGGPYALACAAELQERVIGALVLAGVTDMAWPQAWNGYPRSEVQIMRAESEDAAMALCSTLFGPDGDDFMAASGFELSAPDERLYADPDVASLLSAARVEAFRQGVLGYAQDVFVQGRPWPFDVRSIVSPVRVLHGEEDNLLPRAHSRHTAEVVPGAELQMLAEHGHFSILNLLPSVIGLASRT